MAIVRTPFTSEYANYCSNITCEHSGADATMLSTLRALLIGRIPEGSLFQAIIYRSGFCQEDSLSVHERFFREIQSVISNPYGLCVFNICVHGEIEGLFAGIVDKIALDMEGFTECEDLSLFCSRIGGVRFLINAKKRQTVIFCDYLNTKRLHLMQSLIPRFLPWFFEEKGLSNDEKDLLKSLLDEDFVTYIFILNKIADKCDFREAKIEKLLTGYERLLDEANFSKLATDISGARSEAEMCLRQYSRIQSNLRKLLIEYEGLRQQIANNGCSNEIRDYFISNKKLDIISAYPDEMTFVVKTYLSDYDPEVFGSIINNINSVAFIYENHFNKEEIKTFLNACFGDEPCLKIKVCAAFRFNVENIRVYGLQNFNFSDDNYLPNKHIDRYGCLGDNERHILSALSERNYILAIEQCAQAASNINMCDSVVLEEFMKSFFGRDASNFVELPDGNCCTPREALEWLKEKKEGDSEE